MRALGAYIYAGGFTLGVREHFDVVAHLEDGDFGVSTVRRNLPEVAVHTSPETWPVADYEGVELVFGNPPCSPWSTAGYIPFSSDKDGAVKGREDPRISCVWNLFGLLGQVRPRAWVWESVQPALRKGRWLVDELTRHAHDLGYSATYVLLNGADVGIPSRRRRFFCVFHDFDVPWRYPRQPHVTPREAWEGLPEPGLEDHVPIREQYHEAVEACPPGDRLRNTWERLTPKPWPKNERGHVQGRPGFLHRRLVWDELANTQTGGHILLHPEEDRYISRQEAKRLGGYPDWYEFDVETSRALELMFKAVLPPAGEWLADNLRRGLEADEPPEHRVVLENFEKDHTEVITP